MEYQTDNIIVYDLEVFPGYFLAGFEFPNGEVHQLIISQDNDTHLQYLRDFLVWLTDQGYALAGFNSTGFDDVVLTAFLADPKPEVAYQTSFDIIVNQHPRWKFDNQINSIDLMQILPGRISLKKIGVCLGHSKLQELPVDFNKVPSLEEQQTILPEYNINDLRITRKLLNKIQGELDLRGAMSRKYNIDLRSKGDAQIAEAVLTLEMEQRIGKTKKELNEAARIICLGKPWVTVTAPSWWDSIIVKNPDIQKVVTLGAEIFAKTIPIHGDYLQRGVLDRTVFLGDRYYKMGIGGLHSIDGPGRWIPTRDEFLINVDVASYYPSTILLQHLAPPQTEGSFLEIYDQIYRDRLKAKQEGNKTVADTLKIVLNSTFGLTSSVYSAMYSPEMTANVTVIGQLGLLLLIAMLKDTCDCVSANTDGVLLIGNKTNREQVDQIIHSWETLTGYVMETEEIESYRQRDVNSFIQLAAGGQIKTKGIFNYKWPDLRHTPQANIIATAVKDFIQNGTPLHDTIIHCQDINQFILTQSVSRDWVTSWNDEPLGNMLRFYKSTRPEAGPIIRRPVGADVKGNAGNVPNSENCVPLPDLPEEFPKDIDTDWYINEAEALFATINEKKLRGANRTAEYLTTLGLRPCYVDPKAKTYSRAAVKYGEYDFSSCPPGWVFGTGTGSALIAKISDATTTVLAVDRAYPSRTRATIKKQQGFTLLYGARVPLTNTAGYVVQSSYGLDLDQYYTEAELKKLQVQLEKWKHA